MNKQEMWLVASDFSANSDRNA